MGLDQLDNLTMTNSVKFNQIARKILSRFSRLRSQLKDIYSRLQGVPPVSCSTISKELLRELIDKEDPTILEIGCNDGSQALWFFEVFENPMVYCFEPDPRAIARFKAKVGQNFNIKLFETALCDHNGEVEFYQSDGQADEKEMPNGWDQSGSIREPKNHLAMHPWVKFDQKIIIPASTLDAWCDQHGLGAIDFIWMDVQGAEMDVFRGGKNTLRKTRFLYTEYSNEELYKGQLNLAQLVKYLKIFSVIVRYPGDALLRNRQLTKMPNK